MNRPPPPHAPITLIFCLTTGAKATGPTMGSNLKTMSQNQPFLL
jgi:hypothetical protein